MREESLQDVRSWFLREVKTLWPVAGGSLSLRKNRCIRTNCQACRMGEGHPSYALHYRKGKKQHSIYVPDNLAQEVEEAVRQGRRLQELVVEIGVRYVKALKSRRR